MPRSGSTLVEQILASHPDVYGAGEVKYLSVALTRLRDRFPSLPKYPDMVGKMTTAQLEIIAKDYQQALSQGAGDAKRITDKLLDQLLLPRAHQPLVPEGEGHPHAERDPVDTCLSGFTKLFKDDMPHSYDLAEARPLLWQVSRADGALGEGASRRLHDDASSTKTWSLTPRRKRSA